MTRPIAPATGPSPKEVPLRTGPPTREELLVHYPAKFTWTQLKTFVNSGDLGLLKRDQKLQKRYDAWAREIVAEYGSLVNYLMNYRLQWGKRDTLSLFTSAVDVEEHGPDTRSSASLVVDKKVMKALPPLPDDAPKYFTRDTPPEYLSIIQNDWPYSVPADVEHTLIWTRLPIYHADLVAESIAARIAQDGLWGFTGNTSPPPSPSTLPECLPALADWGVTMDKLIRSEKGTEEEEELVRRAGREVYEFVRKRWDETKWETAWFVNPQRLQSVPGLAHIHVFARQKL
ncbi:putative protein of unknown function (DUF3605) [Lyophyllum shimeji]|uniref:Uncharacterized protein n=1 Tax=Lyophyllum shimeji TaxID=47721 RepID=A0A9P3PLP9_LYOSH|nr:putative protein of unknown function (DUF3605) [Lyophyllum shimeji]